VNRVQGLQFLNYFGEPQGQDDLSTLIESED